jgi:long-chain fatty acid transport protein
MTTPFRHTRLALALAGCALACAAGQVQGAAFGLAEQSGSGLGNAFAGGAAVAEDASTVWSNPAGMSRIPTMQAVAALHIITPSVKFANNDGSIAALNQPLGHMGGDAGTNNFVPNMYLTVPINKELVFGLGVNAPFGLVTSYGDGWLGRYQGMESDLMTINVNPALSWKINDHWAVGAGVSYQRIDATLNQAVNYSGLLLLTGAQAGIPLGSATSNAIAAATSGLDGKGEIKGDDSAWGWNIGVLYNLDDKSRIGAQYRSTIKYNVSGNVTYDIPALPALPPALAPTVGALANALNAARLYNSGVGLDIELPDKFNLSYFGALNNRWDLMADVQWTGWSSIPVFKVVRTNGEVLQDQHWNYKDSWRYSVGTNYHYNDQWMFRGGLAYDETPTNDTDRSVRLPDSDRVWLSVGTQYKMSKNLTFDAGFTYIIGDGASINQLTNATAQDVAVYGKVKGSYDASVTIFSGQVTYSF